MTKVTFVRMSNEDIGAVFPPEMKSIFPSVQIGTAGSVDDLAAQLERGQRNIVVVSGEDPGDKDRALRILDARTGGQKIQMLIRYDPSSKINYRQLLYDELVTP